MSIDNSNLQKFNSILDLFIKSKTVPSLRSILNEQITHEIKKVQEIEMQNLDSVKSSFQDVEDVTAVYVKSTGDFHIGVLLYFTEETSKKLTTKLLGNLQSDELNKITMSSISEIGNILSASVFNALSVSKSCRLDTSVPGYAVETFRTLLESVAAETGYDSDSMVISLVEFYGKNSGILLNMLLIQSPNELIKIVV